jgi:ABC-type ATPase involved in cell division
LGAGRLEVVAVAAAVRLHQDGQLRLQERDIVNTRGRNIGLTRRSMGKEFRVKE